MTVITRSSEVHVCMAGAPYERLKIMLKAILVLHVDTYVDSPLGEKLAALTSNEVPLNSSGIEFFFKN